jgi:uncharacterized protein (TIGR03118 family)
MTTGDSSAVWSTGTQRRLQGTRPRHAYGFRAATVVVAIASTALAGTTATAGASAPVAHNKNAFRQVNLVSDLPMGPHVLLDPAVKNPWGIAMGPHTPLWVNNNFNPASANDCMDPNTPCAPPAAHLLTKVTLYQGANGHHPFEKVDLEVTASAPTGIVFNPTSSFKVRQNGMKAPATFLFNEAVPDPTGTMPVAEITGWKKHVPPPLKTVTTRAKKPGAFFTGLALVPAESKNRKEGPRLLAASDVIDVYDGAFKLVTKPSLFVDPHSVEDGFAPYNVTFLKGRVYVAYASNGGGGGAVSVFTREGRFIKRLVTVDPLPTPPPNSAPTTTAKLDSPWGMAIAPEDWGHFGGALLVGNVDSGEISAFNRRDGHLLGILSDKHGKKLVNPGLWGLAFGNGTIGTPNTLLFAAGIGEAAGGFGDEIYGHGLVGLIKPVR